MASVADNSPLWDLLAVRLGHAIEPIAVVGTGELVPAKMVRARCREMFFDALCHIVPDVVSQMVTPEIAATWGRDSEIPALVPQVILEHVAEWQAEYHLCEEWIFDAAITTIVAYGALGGFGFAFSESECVRFPYGKMEHGNSFDDPNSYRVVQIPVILLSASDFRDSYNRYDGKESQDEIEDRKRFFQETRTIHFNPTRLREYPLPIQHLELNYGKRMSDPGLDASYPMSMHAYGTFDTRRETVEEAHERIMKELSPRVLRSLKHVAEEELSMPDIQQRRVFKSRAAFEWLVRYQVLGESKAQIARVEKKDRTHVTREVNRDADLIGLTLREPKGGRPVKHVG